MIGLSEKQRHCEETKSLITTTFSFDYICFLRVFEHILTNFSKNCCFTFAYFHHFRIIFSKKGFFSNINCSILLAHILCLSTYDAQFFKRNKVKRKTVEILCILLKSTYMRVYFEQVLHDRSSAAAGPRRCVPFLSNQTPLIKPCVKIKKYMWAIITVHFEKLI